MRAAHVSLPFLAASLLSTLTLAQEPITLSIFGLVSSEFASIVTVDPTATVLSLVPPTPLPSAILSRQWADEFTLTLGSATYQASMTLGDDYTLRASCTFDTSATCEHVVIHTIASDLVVTNTNTWDDPIKSGYFLPITVTAGLEKLEGREIVPPGWAQLNGAVPTDTPSETMSGPNEQDPTPSQTGTAAQETESTGSASRVFGQTVPIAALAFSFSAAFVL